MTENSLRKQLLINVPWTVLSKHCFYLYCSSCVTAADRPQRRSSVSHAAWSHARSIAATADVRYACADPIQVNAVRSITRTTNQRQCKRTAIAGCTVNAENLGLVGRESYRAHAFCANKRLVSKSTLAIVSIWFGGSRRGWGVTCRNIRTLQYHFYQVAFIKTSYQSCRNVCKYNILTVWHSRNNLFTTNQPTVPNLFILLLWVYRAQKARLEKCTDM